MHDMSKHRLSEGIRVCATLSSMTSTSLGYSRNRLESLYMLLSSVGKANLWRNTPVSKHRVANVSGAQNDHVSTGAFDISHSCARYTP